MKSAGPAYCMAVTVYSALAMSIMVSSWAAISLVQSSVTTSAGVSGPGSIASASPRNRSASARQACSPSSLSSGIRSSYPGMPYMLAANGFSVSQR
jgi:hypothetical protein